MKKLPILNTSERTAIVHAGTKRTSSGAIITDGGRVLGVSAQAESLEKAAKIAYSVCDQVQFESKYLRLDIAHQELNRGMHKSSIVFSETNKLVITLVLATLAAAQWSDYCNML